MTATRVLLILLFLCNNATCHAEISCSYTRECEEKLRPGSTCVDGFCSNPFVQGCIKTMMKTGSNLDSDWNAKLNDNHAAITEQLTLAFKGRVCNSDDTNKDITTDEYSNSICIENEFKYPEIRIHNANWESSIFLSWIMQIMLMEVLRVPVSVGLNTNVTNITSFYSPRNTLEYSQKIYPWKAIEKGGTPGGDCEKTNEDCVQVLPEVWKSQLSNWISATQMGHIEPVDGCGQVGKIGWFIPYFTANKYPALAIFHGLQGEKNREVLAQTFQRPTSWTEYCEEVSVDNCTTSTSNSIAMRYPETEKEGNKYFKERHYNGYFRMLPENNCTQFPKTCTGYMVSPICKWSTYVDAQIYWNGIVGLALNGPLLNRGYEYASMKEIWKAANATKSDLMMWWWHPEAIVQESSLSNTSFQEVSLPAVTDVCSNARIQDDDRCSENITVRRGSSKGACENEAHALRKVISSSLQRQDRRELGALRSPGYQYIRLLKVSNLEIHNLLGRWNGHGIDPYGNDAREAVCSWVIANMDTLLGFVPPGYPKEIDRKSSYKEEYSYAATALAVFCALGIFITAGFVYRWRLTKVFVYAQESFVRIILFGSFLVCIGALLFSLEPTAFTCVARDWFINLGYNIELAAVLVKISTINRIMSSSKRLKRVKVSPQAMYSSLGLLVGVALCYLVAWTLLSPPQAIENRVLSGEYKIEVSLKCQSEQVIWSYFALIWHTLLLIVASVLAFQSRGTVAEFNESRTFGTMIYSHFLFMILRIIVFCLDVRELIQPNLVGACFSFLFSSDSLFAVVIYVIPKCIEAKKAPAIYRAAGRSSIVRSSPYAFKYPSLRKMPNARNNCHRELGLPSSTVKSTKQHSNERVSKAISLENSDVSHYSSCFQSQNMIPEHNESP